MYCKASTLCTEMCVCDRYDLSRSYLLYVYMQIMLFIYYAHLVKALQGCIGEVGGTEPVVISLLV
jgi:hypothetical protein